MTEAYTNINSFWCQIVQPGDPQEVSFPEDSYLTITNVSISESNSLSQEPVRLLLHVLTKKLDDPDTTVASDVLIATLIPGKSEQQVINIVLSPLNAAKLEIKGSLPIHISGHFSRMDSAL